MEPDHDPDDSNDIAEIVAIHNRNIDLENPKLVTRKRKRHRGTYVTSSSSSVADDSDVGRKYKSDNRNLGARKRRKRRVSLSRIARADVNMKQLNGHCLSHLDEPIDLLEVVISNNEYQTLPPKQRRKFLLDMCKSRPSGQQRFAVTLRSKTHDVCNTCFGCFHGVSRRTVQRALKDKNSGVARYDAPDEDDAPKRSDTLLNLEAAAWITRTYVHYGDFMPDESTVCLPVYSKTELHNWYVSSNHDIPHYSSSEFMRVLRRDFPFITFRQYKKFMQCEFCHDVDFLVKQEKVRHLALGCVCVHMSC